MRPRLLDLFCGAGGVAMGYHRTGFSIYGVDNRPQKHYPFPFIQMDAMEAMDRLLRGEGLIFSNGETLYLVDFVAFHASPPCQRYTQMLNHGLTPRTNHPDLIYVIRDKVSGISKPFIIENVFGSPLVSPIMLCGEMFGLRVTRHRYFEASFVIPQPQHPKHKGKGIRKQNDGGFYYRVYGHETGKASWGEAMGIDWMRSPELAQSIPPAYTEYIGKYLLMNLDARVGAKQ